MKKYVLLASTAAFMFIQGYSNDASARRPFSQKITEEARFIASSPGGSIDDKVEIFLSRGDVKMVLEDKIYRRAEKMKRGTFDENRRRGLVSAKIADASRRVSKGSAARDEASKLVVDINFKEAVREKMRKRVGKIKAGRYTK